MLLAQIIARALAIVDSLLAYFVDLTTADLGTDCYTFTVYNATITDCGQEMIFNLQQLIQGLIGLAPTLLGALFSFSSEPAV
jgi:hypothetical protein